MRLNMIVCVVLMAWCVPVAVGAEPRAATASFVISVDRADNSWEPAVHAQTHPKDANQYSIRGYRAEIFGCRDDMLQHLHKIPYGGRIYEHIPTTGCGDDEILRLDAGEVLFVRGFNWLDNPTSIAELVHQNP